MLATAPTTKQPERFNEILLQWLDTLDNTAVA